MPAGDIQLKRNNLKLILARSPRRGGREGEKGGRASRAAGYLEGGRPLHETPRVSPGFTGKKQRRVSSVAEREGIDPPRT